MASQRTKNILRTIYLTAVGYVLLAIIGFLFVIPAIFDIDKYTFPGWLEGFLKVTIAASILTILSWPIVYLMYSRHAKTYSRPYALIAILQILGLLSVVTLGLYIYLNSCEVESESWQCTFEGKGLVLYALVAVVLAACCGLVYGLVSKLRKKPASHD